MPKAQDPGRFVWRELVTPDVAAAKTFYNTLFGWSFRDHDSATGMPYTLLQLDGFDRGGMMPSPDPGMPPHWMVYVSVPDVDVAAEAAQAAGGQVMHGPMTIPGTGRFAVVRDPQGAHFTVYRHEAGDGAAERPPNGAFCWEQLHTSDVEGAKAFYAKVVGWEVKEAFGQTVFANGEALRASVQVLPAGAGAPPHWLTFIAVANAEQTVTRAGELGASVLVPVTPLPDLGRFAVLADPAGATFAVFQGAPMAAG